MLWEARLDTQKPTQMVAMRYRMMMPRSIQLSCIDGCLSWVGLKANRGRDQKGWVEQVAGRCMGKIIILSIQRSRRNTTDYETIGRFTGANGENRAGKCE